MPACCILCTSERCVKLKDTPTQPWAAGSYRLTVTLSQFLQCIARSPWRRPGPAGSRVGKGLAASDGLGLWSVRTWRRNNCLVRRGRPHFCSEDDRPCWSGQRAARRTREARSVRVLAGLQICRCLSTFYIDIMHCMYTPSKQRLPACPVTVVLHCVYVQSVHVDVWVDLQTSLKTHTHTHTHKKTPVSK